MDKCLFKVTSKDIRPTQVDVILVFLQFTLNSSSMFVIDYVNYMSEMMMIMRMSISLPPAFLCHVTKSLSFLPYKARKFKNQSNGCPPTFYLDLYQDVTWATHGTCT